MSQRRTLILVAALAIGLVAAFMVWNYVDGVKDDAMGDAKLVTVYVVKATIPRGTSAEAAQVAIAPEQYPQKFKPENAVTNPADIAGQVAVTDLPVNQVLVLDQWVEAGDPSARTSFSEQLRKINDEDMTAITIQVDGVRGVAGSIEPNDYVNIMLTNTKQLGSEESKTPEEKAAEEAAGAAGGDLLFSSSARYLYLKAQVLAIGSVDATAAASAEGAAPVTSNRGLITLILPTKASQYIASVKAENIYLSLVADDYTPERQGRISPTDPLPAEDETQLTPYGPKGADAGK